MPKYLLGSATASPVIAGQLLASPASARGQKAVFDNFGELTTLHPALGHLDSKTMVKDGPSAPLHSGVNKYYKEKGWL
jgi:TRAP-type uncharacterized transport system substrate-binding protein